LAALAASPSAWAGTAIWTGANSNTDLSWSDAANWNGGGSGPGGVPTLADDVLLNDTAALPYSGNVDNIVDTSAAGAIGSLTFASTDTGLTNYHTTQIGDGITLLVGGTTSNGLFVGGTYINDSVNELVNAAFTGAGTLCVSNTNGVLFVGEGESNQYSTGSLNATLDLSGLGRFVANVSRTGIGDNNVSGLGNTNTYAYCTGTVYLAETNIITNHFAGSPVNDTTDAYPLSAIEVGRNSVASAGGSYLYLGVSNAIYVDSIAVGLNKANGHFQFNPNNSSGGMAWLRGAGGDNSRIRFWTIADMSSTVASSVTAHGTCDFTLASVNALVDTMSLSRDSAGATSGTPAGSGNFYMGMGSVNVNTLYIGNSYFGNPSSQAGQQGLFWVLSGQDEEGDNIPGVLTVNSNMTIGNTVISGQAAVATQGALAITNGIVYANNITVGPFAPRNLGNIAGIGNSILMNGGTLIVTNALATNADTLVTMYMNDSILGLTASPAQSLSAQAEFLAFDGDTNVLELLSAPVFPTASYPVQFPLIAYTSLTGPAGYNLGLSNVPASAPGAFLSNNTANSSIDLCLPGSPAPGITTEPAGFGGPVGTSPSLSVGLSAYSVTPLSYQWYKGATLVTNGAGGGGSTISGATTGTLTINNAQTANNGNYTVVVSNVYGVVTSSPAASIVIGTPTLPSITGLSNSFAVASNIFTFTAVVAGNPSPTEQWYQNGVSLSDGLQGNGSTLSGSLTPDLTISNVQYNASAGSYSLVAANSVGKTTNTISLTVYVKPSISVQPANPTLVSATSNATFTVTATGVPAPAYQWYTNSTADATGTSATYTIPGAELPNAGNYNVYVIASNAAGTVTSSTAKLIVVALSSPIWTGANSNTDINWSDYHNWAGGSANGKPGTNDFVTFEDAEGNPGYSGGSVDNIVDASSTIGGLQYATTNNSHLTQIPLGNVLVVAGTNTNNLTVGTLTDNGNNQTVYAAFTGGGTLCVSNTNGAVDVTQGQVSAVTLGSGLRATLDMSALGTFTAYMQLMAVGDNITPGGASSTEANHNYAAGTVLLAQTNILTNLLAGTATNYAGSYGSASIMVGRNNTGQGNTSYLYLGQQNTFYIDSLALGMIKNSSYMQYNPSVSTGTACFRGTNGNNSRIRYWTEGTMFVSANTGGGVCNGYVDFTSQTSGGGSGAVDMMVDTMSLAQDGPGSMGSSSASSGSFTFGQGNVDVNTLYLGNVYFGNSAGKSPLLGTMNVYGPGVLHVNNVLALANAVANTTAGQKATGTLNINSGTVYANNITVGRYSAANNAINMNGGTLYVSNSVATNAGVAGSALSTLSVSGALLGLPIHADGTPSALVKTLTSAGGNTLQILSVPPFGSYPATVKLIQCAANSSGVSAFSLSATNPQAAAGAALALDADGQSIDIVLQQPTNTNNTPTIAAITSQTVNPGATLSVTAVGSDNTPGGVWLTYSLLSAPAGAAVNATTGVITWTPGAAQANSVNTITVQVADNGVPAKTASTSFQVTVNPVAAIPVSAAKLAGGHFEFTFGGGSGLNYAVQTSTNLTHWTTVFTTNSPALPFQYVDPGLAATNVDVFYRATVVGP
jgi:hypothetical protein